MKIFSLSLLVVLVLIFPQEAWACNCISQSGETQAIYRGITIFLSLIPVVLMSGLAIFARRLVKLESNQSSDLL